jgi:ribosomal protein S18 acetylase RimI-like enzyme
MAATEEDQGKGFGKLLLQKAERILSDKGIQIIWCNARINAMEFYKKLGYQVMGKEFEVAEVGPHFKMYKALI